MTACRFFIFGLCAWLTFGSTSLEAMAKTASTQEIKINNLAVRTLHYGDENRQRPVIVELWYPTEQTGPFETGSDAIWVHPQEIRDAPFASLPSKCPLILMSHGNRGDRRERSWLAASLVRKGFVVAAVEHYGNSRTTYNPMLTMQFWERPRDVVFALDQLSADASMQEMVDFQKVGFVGYSLGGMTGLA